MNKIGGGLQKRENRLYTNVGTFTHNKSQD